MKVKKIIASLLLIGLLSSIAVAGTTHFNSDVAVSGSDYVIHSPAVFNFLKSDSTTTESIAGAAVLGDTGSYSYTVPFAGSVVGIGLSNNALLTAGVMSAEVYVNGTATGFEAFLDSTTSMTTYSAQAVDTDTVAAGDTISVSFEAASIAPSGSIDSIISVFVYQ